MVVSQRSPPLGDCVSSDVSLVSFGLPPSTSAGRTLSPYKGNVVNEWSMTEERGKNPPFPKIQNSPACTFLCVSTVNICVCDMRRFA